MFDNIKKMPDLAILFLSGLVIVAFDFLYTFLRDIILSYGRDDIFSLIMRVFIAIVFVKIIMNSKISTGGRLIAIGLAISSYVSIYSYGSIGVGILIENSLWVLLGVGFVKIIFEEIKALR